MPRIHLGVYMTSGNETSRAVRYALQAGYRAVDSAEWYANEREVGTSILSFLSSAENKVGLKREDIWFTTKLKSNVDYDTSRKKIKESVKRSGLGYVDLYLLHSPYGGKDRRRECWRAVEDAVLEGEVKVGGVSNFGVRHVSVFFLFFFLCDSSRMVGYAGFRTRASETLDSGEIPSSAFSQLKSRVVGNFKYRHSRYVYALADERMDS
jgi:aryl-alcohol dehydrogenase-like predicted oxidoreductase